MCASSADAASVASSGAILRTSECFVEASVAALIHMSATLAVLGSCICSSV